MTNTWWIFEAGTIYTLGFPIKNDDVKKMNWNSNSILIKMRPTLTNRQIIILIKQSITMLSVGNINICVRNMVCLAKKKRVDWKAAKLSWGIIYVYILYIYGIPGSFIKNIACHLAGPMSHSFNSFLASAYCPHI